MVISILLLVISTFGLFVPVTAADIEMEGYLGETITLHGYSYVGDSVYLFLTGPGLPVNGVTLTDVSQRADQGHFTVVLVDDNQEWTYFWKTSRIDSEIDPGTYTVYVTNEPADLTHLGSSRSYKSLSVFLKDSGVPKVSINASHAYPLNPEEDVSTPHLAPSMNITNATPVATTPPITTTITAIQVQKTVPTTRASLGPWTAMMALLCCTGLLSFLKRRP